MSYGRPNKLPDADGPDRPLTDPKKIIRMNGLRLEIIMLCKTNVTYSCYVRSNATYSCSLKLDHFLISFEEMFSRFVR